MSHGERHNLFLVERQLLDAPLLPTEGIQGAVAEIVLSEWQTPAHALDIFEGVSFSVEDDALEVSLGVVLAEDEHRAGVTGEAADLDEGGGQLNLVDVPMVVIYRVGFEAGDRADFVGAAADQDVADDFTRWAAKKRQNFVVLGSCA